MLDCGRALQRVWLTATAAGLGIQPTATAAFLDRASDEPRSILDHEERVVARRLLGTIRGVAGIAGAERIVMVLRVVHAPDPAVRALRRSLDEMVTVVP